MRVARRFLLIPFLLSGCSGLDLSMGTAAWPWLNLRADPVTSVASPAGAAARPSAHFSFDWSLAGDRDIMPLQVFDDGQRMWLQFAAGGALPAIFKVAPEGLTPLTYRHEPPYLILDGVHSHLELRGGHLSGVIRRAPAGVSEIAEITEAYPAPRAVAIALSDTLAAPETKVSDTKVPDTKVSGSNVPGTAVMAGRLAPPMPAQTQSGAGAGGDRPTSVLPPVSQNEVAVDVTLHVEPVDRVSDVTAVLGTVSRSEPEEDRSALYAVSPADGTMRQALARWSDTAGWTFTPEHWAVDVDIPLVGSASFLTDFKSAVRDLVAATEMGDRPLQPCFYANRVLRVVPFAQPCDRRGGMGVMS